MSGHVQSCTSEAMPSFHKYGYGGGVFRFFSILFFSIKTLTEREQTRERERGGSPGIGFKTWMTLNCFMLNTAKTEVIVLGPKNLRNKLSKDILTLDGIHLASSETVRNLGVIFDQDLSFNLLRTTLPHWTPPTVFFSRQCLRAS